METPLLVQEEEDDTVYVAVERGYRGMCVNMFVLLVSLVHICMMTMQISYGLLALGGMGLTLDQMNVTKCEDGIMTEWSGWYVYFILPTMITIVCTAPHHPLPRVFFEMLTLTWILVGAWYIPTECIEEDDNWAMFFVFGMWYAMAIGGCDMIIYLLGKMLVILKIGNHRQPMEEGASYAFTHTTIEYTFRTINQV